MSLLCVENFDSAPWSLPKLWPMKKENLLEPGLIYLQPRPQGSFQGFGGGASPPGKIALGRGCSIWAVFTKRTFRNKQGKQTNYNSLPRINGNF